MDGEVLPHQWPAESCDRSDSRSSQSAPYPIDQTLLCSRISFWRAGSNTAGILSGIQGSTGQPRSPSYLLSQIPSAEAS